MVEEIVNAAQEAVRASQKLLEEKAVTFINDVSSVIADCYRMEGKVLVTGNGGSLCDGMHFAEELTGFFRGKRRALGAIPLSDPAHMSCVGNDLGFEAVFSRAVEALGRSGDVFICLSTSGNSSNLVEAVKVAREKELTTVAFLGKKGGALTGHVDYEWVVDGFETSDRIQEAHMAAAHIMIEMIEKKLGLAQAAACEHVSSLSP